jgi:hypothetical protein
MSNRRALAAESHFIDAVARRVVELLESGRGNRTSAPCNGPGEYLTVAQVAERYQVSRSWVYAHQRELGAIRMGSGPKAHLRFDAHVVAKAIAAMAEQGPDELANCDTRGRGRELRLIPFEPMDQRQRL